MSGFREIKRQARRDLHQGLSDAVLYIPEPNAVPVAITVRLHTAFSDEGGLGSSAWAERHEITPKIRFLDTVPQKDGLIVTEDMGVFLIGTTFPAHDISIDANVTKLSKGQAATEGLDVTLPWCGLTYPVLP